jgi:hypothetical protein
MKSTVWKSVKGQLAHRTERDFEREVLRVLSLRWTGLIQAASLKHFDRQGIDLIDWGDGAPFSCVVQCKGFTVLELTRTHEEDALASIEKFRASGYRCETYVFVYNRERRDYPFHARVEAAAHELQRLGLTARALVWDIDGLVQAHQHDVLTTVETALQENTRRMLARLEQLFDTGGLVVESVPLEERRLLIQRGEPARIEPIRPAEDRRVSDLLVDPGDQRWAILIGEFGAGKSTAALHAASLHAMEGSSNRRIIYAEARAFDRHRIHGGLHGLLGELLRSSLALLEGLPEPATLNPDEIIRRAVPLLKELMGQRDAPFVVVIDGLDEARAFETVRGMVTLNNSLIELGCPVVLITRREHFVATFETFDLSLSELSKKFGSRRRPAALFVLHRWDPPHVLTLLDRIIEDADAPRAKAHLAEFRSLIASGSGVQFYADLPFNPLFLRFILDDVLADGVRSANRSQLLERWLRRKIARELAKGRELDLAPSADGGSVVDALLRAMEVLAAAMVEAGDGAIKLRESLPVEGIGNLLGADFAVARGDVTALMLNTVLVPVEFLGAGRYRIAFAFLVFRDFFLARHLRRIGGDAALYPAEVGNLLREMQDAEVAAALEVLL